MITVAIWRLPLMNNVNIQSSKGHDTIAQLPVSSQGTFPPAPFPRKYVHSVFDDLQDAMQAVHALRAAGYDVRDIHLMAGWDFLEAVEGRRTFLGFLFSIDYQVYFPDAPPGHHLLLVPLPRTQANAERTGFPLSLPAYLLENF